MDDDGELGRLREENAQLRAEIDGMAAAGAIPKEDAFDMLCEVISDISEERWCAGWYCGIEHILWDELKGLRPSSLTPEQRRKLAMYSAACGGWSGGHRSFTPLDRWERYHAEHGAAAIGDGDGD